MIAFSGHGLYHAPNRLMPVFCPDSFSALSALGLGIWDFGWDWLGLRNWHAALLSMNSDPVAVFADTVFRFAR